MLWAQGYNNPKAQPRLKGPALLWRQKSGAGSASRQAWGGALRSALTPKPLDSRNLSLSPWLWHLRIVLANAAQSARFAEPRGPLPAPIAVPGHGSEAGSSGPGEGGAPSLAPGPLWSGPWLLVLTAGQHHFTHFPDFSCRPNESILTAVKTVVRYSCHRYRFLCTKDPPFMGGLRNSRGDVPLPSQTSHRKQRVS